MLDILSLIESDKNCAPIKSVDSYTNIGRQYFKTSIHPDILFKHFVSILPFKIGHKLEEAHIKGGRSKKDKQKVYILENTKPKQPKSKNVIIVEAGEKDYICVKKSLIDNSLTVTQDTIVDSTHATIVFHHLDEGIQSIIEPLDVLILTDTIIDDDLNFELDAGEPNSARSLLDPLDGFDIGKIHPTNETATYYLMPDESTIFKLAVVYNKVSELDAYISYISNIKLIIPIDDEL